MQNELEDARRQFKADPSRGYISRRGNTGRIVPMDPQAGRISVDTPKGSLNVRIGEHTVVRKYGGDTVLTIDDLKAGSLVVVDEARTDADDTTKIEMVPGARTVTTCLLVKRLSAIDPSGRPPAWHWSPHAQQQRRATAHR